ncbi:MAG TPA: SDR family oxidoreductase, partial [Herpetosiphonaceae bacterium]
VRLLAAGLPPAGWPDDLWLVDQGWRWRPPRAAPGDPAADLPHGLSRLPDLRKPGCCYVCKIRFQRRHFWYDQLCQECGDANYARREQRADLGGLTALVTGGRINIGYATVLRLLRNGARVIATSRFPRDAARRFAAEPDSARWLDRLALRGLDLRFLPEVERFAAELRGAYPKLDILINNAAQTVRQPAAYYAPLLAGELGPDSVPPALLGVIGDASPGAPDDHPAALATIPPPASYLAALARELAAGGGGAPPNSWTLTLDELPLSELVEAQLVNALAPAVLIQQLKPLLLKGRPAFIVNVAAAEGQFARAKRPYHPHTNMAKAALNMLTHTAAAGYAAEGVFINSVDPGWVSLQAPAAGDGEPPASLPIDLADAAARICAPVFDGLLGGAPAAGKLFKDYAEAPW